jgi:GT2 family glycosyltransferase
MCRMSPSVAAVVVTHQSARFLPACLDSLAAHGRGVDLSILVADSGSTDEVEAICRERGVAFLAGPNRGYGAAVNRALEHDSVRRAQYVLVMNPDLRILDGSLADFVARCEQRPECGVFAPRQVDQHGGLVCSIGREPTPEDYWRAWRTGWSDWVWEPEVYEREGRCDWVMGAFMLVRRRLFDELGGFDERFVLFSEEVDLGTRARRAGWQIAYLPQLTIEHWKADRPLDEHRERMIMWSELVYMRKWHGRRARASMRLALVARLTRQLARRLWAREPARGEWVRLCAALRFRSSRYAVAT